MRKDTKPVSDQPKVETSGEKLDLRGPNQAEVLLEQRRKERAGKQSHQKASDDADWQYYQECRRGHVALYYASNPFDKEITPKDWYARYKRQDEPWKGNVLCQECSTYDEEGHLIEEVPIQLNAIIPSHRQTVKFMVDPRWVFRESKNAEKRRLGKPHRVMQLAVSAANVGVPNPDFPEAVRNPRRETKEVIHNG